MLLWLVSLYLSYFSSSDYGETKVGILLTSSFFSCICYYTDRLLGSSATEPTQHYVDWHFTRDHFTLFTEDLVDSCKGLSTPFDQLLLSDPYYFLLQVLQHHAQQMA